MRNELWEMGFKHDVNCKRIEEAYVMGNELREMGFKHDVNYKQIEEAHPNER